MIDCFLLQTKNDIILYMSSDTSDPLDMTAKKTKPPRKAPSTASGKVAGKVAKPASRANKQQSVELIIMNSPPKDAGCKSSHEHYLDFLKTLPKKQQTELLQKEAALVGFKTQPPLKYRLLMSDMSNESKQYALQRMQTFQDLTPDDNEYPKQKEWFETLLRVPFGVYRDLTVDHRSSSATIAAFLHDAQSALNQSVYGMHSAKSTILELIAGWITNPNSMCRAIALHGEKGTGKTSIAFHGLARALDRPLHLISLGGCKDSSYLSGHEYTYLGSHCGHLVDILIASGCMNPIILFDELDKVSESPAGQEVIGNLIHLIDATQNTAIKDRYFGNVQFDLSRVMFVFSFNDASKVDPILLDRMVKINIDSYKTSDKVNIAKKFFIPDIAKNLGLSTEKVVLDSDLIKYIIDKYTQNEKGVRSLRKCIESLYSKINILLLTNANAPKLDLTYVVKNLSLPFILTHDIIDKMLNRDFGNSHNDVPVGMYV